MKKLLHFAIFILLPFFGFAQTFTDSNLPIVLIETDINPNTGNPRSVGDNATFGSMKIIYRPDGSRNHVNDKDNPEFLNYNGRIDIKFRGSSSRTLPKKPYSVNTWKDDNATNNNVSILGMPQENDWILNSLAFDASLIRNYLSYDLSRSIGNYAARGVYCEVVINGDYKGLYIFMERIKIDSERVNIVKMSETDINAPNVTGGYITKADKRTGGDPVAWTMQSYNGQTEFIHHQPKPSDITSQQHTYIRDQFTQLQNKASAQNASVVNGFPSIIDIPTFIDFMIINELASNADAYQFSTYFHKERNGKLRAGPVWDFDLTYGNDLFQWHLDRSHTNVWQFDNGDNTGARFWRDLHNNPTFKCYLSKRWKELTVAGGPLSYGVITTKIDQLLEHIAEARAREHHRWGTLSNHANEITKMKSWLQTRINWLNGQWSNTQACTNVSVPSLAISKIHYNPIPTDKYSSNDLEFVEITNNSNTTADLTGIYFKELGFTYHFPASAKLAPHAKLYLAGNRNAFRQNYGFNPFGQFTRSLSNESENLVLIDAFGNMINSVKYENSAPWPVEANRGGYFLQLTDIDADNSKGENWTVGNELEKPLDASQSNSDNSLKIYPNPTQTSITVTNNNTFNMIEIYSLDGRKVFFENVPNIKSYTLDIESFSPSIYILKIHGTHAEIRSQKIIKLP
jgi:hypothetical protein